MREVAGRTGTRAYGRAVGKDTAVVAPSAGRRRIVVDPCEAHLVAGGEAQLVGRRPPIEADGQHAVGVDHEADATSDVSERRRHHRRPHLIAEVHAHDVAPALDVGGPDVQLRSCRTDRPTAPRRGSSSPSCLGTRDEPGTSSAGSTASPSSDRSTPLQRWAATGAKTSRPANVAPGAARWNAAFGQLDGSDRAVDIAAAGTRRPLSGPTSTPSPSATSTAMARRSVPTPGSTTASDDAGRHVLDGPGQRERAGAHVIGTDLVRQVEDGDVAGEVADDRLDDPDELVGRAVVGEQRHGVVVRPTAAPRATVADEIRQRRPMTTCRDANRADANPPMASALSARPDEPAPPRGGRRRATSRRPASQPPSSGSGRQAGPSPPSGMTLRQRHRREKCHVGKTTIPAHGRRTRPTRSVQLRRAPASAASPPARIRGTQPARRRARALGDRRRSCRRAT